MTFSSRVAELKDKGFFENIEISRGIEKESLRVKTMLNCLKASSKRTWLSLN